LEDLNPVTDVVPRVDMNALAELVRRISAQVGSGREGLEEVLGLDGETDTDWDAWLKDMPKTLTQIEDMMRDTLGIDQKRGAAAEAFYNPWARTYNDNAWRTPGAIEIDSANLAPLGELNPGSGVRIDGTTGEILGESFPIPDIDVDQILSALQAEAGSGVSDFTGMMPGAIEEPAWRTRSREERNREELEGGEYWPVIHEGPRTIRTVTGKDVQTLIDRNINFELLNEDGSSLTTAQIEELMAGTSTQPVYIKNVHTGTADEAGLFGEEDYSGINFLTDADIAGLLGPIPGAATKHGQGLAARIEERERAEEEKVASAGAQTTKTSARPRRRRR